MKFISTVTCLFLSCALSLSGQDIYRQQRAAWLQIAERCKPKLVNKLEKPVQLTTLVKDEQAFQGWKAVRSGSIDSLYQVSFESKNGVIVDFGKHLTGYVSIVLSPLQKTPDAPIRLKLTAGEVPSELATSFDNYQGGLSRAWLQDEILTVMNIPDTITIARRLAFRYVKIELLTVPQYTFRISDISCTSV
ncbi:MAG: glycoside hydrolase, partial [Bacteroidota bacterium]|nr:glycoside hydrolase [Bacteroidota bacterium]